ncbi:hypothetical protein SH661x_001227 [Planctomicrobium sp. SH661]|uniref:hypothetical protein n=1 Tax=Planctomicrobium sp. SH661 TaxID=3448124 RepID=UPI003F5BF688
MRCFKSVMLMLSFTWAGNYLSAQEAKTPQTDATQIPTADLMLQSIAAKEIVAEGRVRTLNFPADVHAYQVLEKTTDFNFPNHTLREALRAISDQNGTNILLDMKAMEELGMDGEEGVSIVLSDVKLRTALRLLVENAAGARLGYFVDGGVIIVTSRERAGKEMSVRIYQVRDLIKNQESIAALVTVIQNATSPSWNISGEDAPSITPFGTTIVIRQTQSVHDEITSLLNALGEAAEGEQTVSLK